MVVCIACCSLCKLGNLGHTYHCYERGDDGQLGLTACRLDQDVEDDARQQQASCGAQPFFDPTFSLFT